LTFVNSRLHEGVRASPTEAAVSPQPARGWLGGVISAIDLVLRYCFGVRQFCADRRCIIRIGLGTARQDVRLLDGTQIKCGDAVGELHFWNEQLPAIPWSGPGFAWALTMRRQFEHSLVQLAIHAERNGALAEIAAFHGEISFAGPPSRKAKLGSVAARHGFEVVERRRSGPGAIHDFFNSVFILCLIRTFNPAGLTSKSLIRRRYEVWISKRTLIEQYGAFADRTRTRSTPATEPESA
jgi:hypothetical protein